MNIKFKKIINTFGDVLWVGDDLAGDSAGYQIAERFITEQYHPKWSLSIYNPLLKSSAEIDCPIDEMPKIIAYVYNIEHGYPMTFIGENLLTESYVVGIPCTRGRIETPGVYKAENGRLKFLGEY